jgi:hypothetical protein
LARTPALDVPARIGLTRSQWTWLVAGVALVGIVATKLMFRDMFRAFSIAWWILPLPIGIAAWTMRRERLQQPAARSLLAVGPVLAIFPLLVVLNGACPYLGSKTETAFAMYSNLRTEGGATNHLLLPRPLALFDYQTDLVQIESSSDAVLSDLAREGHPVPFYVLRKRVNEVASAGATGIAIQYTRAGQTSSTTAAERDPELSRAPSYLERKLLRFRTILPRDANVCSH